MKTALMPVFFFALAACEPPAQTSVDLENTNTGACAEIALSANSPWGFWGLNAETDLIYFRIRAPMGDKVKKIVFTVRTTQSFAGPSRFDLFLNGKYKDAAFGEWKEGATLVFFPKTEVSRDIHFGLKGDLSGLDCGVEVAVDITEFTMSSCQVVSLPVSGKVLFLKN